MLFGFRLLTLRMFLFAAAFAADYFVAMSLAPMLPGAGWAEPEFVKETLYPLGLAPQQLIAYVICALALLAVSLAVLQR